MKIWGEMVRMSLPLLSFHRSTMVPNPRRAHLELTPTPNPPRKGEGKSGSRCVFTLCGLNSIRPDPANQGRLLQGRKQAAATGRQVDFKGESHYLTAVSY